MATLTEIVNGLKTQVEGFATSLATKLDELNTARDGANTAAGSAFNTLASAFSITRSKVIWVDAVNGDDANAGSAPNVPVKTWAGVYALMHGGFFITVNLLSDLVVDTNHSISWSPNQIYIVGYNTDGTAIQQRKITFVNATNNGNVGGWIFSGRCNISCYSIDLEMAHNLPSYPLYLFKAEAYLHLNLGTITRTGTGGPMFGGGFAGHFHAVNLNIDPSASGHIIQGVASGGDPNAISGLSANFTQS